MSISVSILYIERGGESEKQDASGYIRLSVMLDEQTLDGFETVCEVVFFTAIARVLTVVSAI
jgi:hypothetical protein